MYYRRSRARVRKGHLGLRGKASKERCLNCDDEIKATRIMK